MATTDHPSIERICYRCKLPKPLDAFHRDGKRTGGTQRECKLCCSIRSAVRLYGITWEQAADFRARTECDICGPATYLVIDHDHETNQVRGVLCQSCNLGVGAIERPGFLDKAVNYLELHRNA